MPERRNMVPLYEPQMSRTDPENRFNFAKFWDECQSYFIRNLCWFTVHMQDPCNFMAMGFGFLITLYTFTVFCLCTYLYCFVVLCFFMFCSCFVVVVVLCIFIFVCTSVGLLPPGESPIAVNNNNNNNIQLILNWVLKSYITIYITCKQVFIVPILCAMWRLSFKIGLATTAWRWRKLHRNMLGVLRL
jgi:hypothetical protein